MCEVSVIVPCYNDQENIEACISSLLNQTYHFFELLIINDGSTDRSLQLIKSAKDERIILIDNPHTMGAASARNLALSKAQGEYLFFTDSDCIVDKKWIQTGLEEIKSTDCLGLEGKTYYVSENYVPEFLDKLPGDVGNDQQYMTCNMVYKREIFNKIGGFDPKYIYHSDREFALRVLKQGKISFCQNMIVVHREKKWTIKSYLSSSRRIGDRIRLYKYHDDRFAILHRIHSPRNLIKIIIPPLAVMKPLISGKIKSWNDLKFIPFIYLRLIYERLIIWETALKEKVFII